MSDGNTRFNCPTTDNKHIINDYALARIDFRVGRLAQAFRLREDEADDLRQDMVAELLKAGVRYDPARSRRNTFVTRILDRHYRHIARGLCNRQRHEAMKPTPFSAMKSFCSAINDPGRGELSEQERTELRIDLVHVVASMPAKLRCICAVLKVHNPREAAEHLGIHRGTIYRAINEIRHCFVAAGLGGAA